MNWILGSIGVSLTLALVLYIKARIEWHASGKRMDMDRVFPRNPAYKL